MALKVRRQGRKWRLTYKGFLPFEAHALSSVPTKTPYLRRMERDRRVLVKRAMDEGWTRKEFAKEVLDLYRAKGWMIKETAVTRTKRVGWADPWAMLKHYRDEYNKEAPEPWVSPSEKKGKKKKKTKIDDSAVQEGRRRKRLTFLEKYARKRGRE